MSLRLVKLQELDTKSQKVQEKGLKKDWKNVHGVLYHKWLPFVSEII